ncbi:MAG: nitroreductase family protein, partial [Phycisphaerales bacterium]
MDRRAFLRTLPALGVLAGMASSLAQDLEPITLAKPQTEGGKSVLEALSQRRTTRNISSDKLPPQMLSNLLWAAFGVNRQQGPFGGPGRTAASASNSQEIDLYVALPEGVYLYDAAAHRLMPVV